MRNTLLTYIDGFRQNRRERLVLGFVLLFLAVIVSLTVYWQLRYTGITMSNETFCGYEEHVHTEECYDEEGNLICELEEHSHTVDCLINLNADVEDATVWKATLPELTGDLRTDVVNIAYSQLGYTESTANFSPGEDGVTRYGYTRYGAWYGNEYGTWDAMFVSFCLNYAGVDRTAFPLNSGAYSWAVELSEIGSYAEASAYTPLAGDIAFFDTDLDGRIDRVGIVASTDISGGVVTIIEGDYTVFEVDTVCEHIYALNDPTISGYGIIAVSEEVEEVTEEAETEETDDETEDTEETEEETEESPTLFYTASDSGVNVTVIAPEGALPDGATLAVTLLDEESDEYAEAAEAVGYEDSEDTGMAALNITFYDELGIEVEPTLPVTVTVDITEIIPEGTTADTIEVTHITDTEVSTVEPLVETVTDTTDETAVVVFETESFSTFTLQWYTHNGGGPYSGYQYGAVIYVSIYADGVLASGDSLSYTVDSSNSTSLTLSISDLTSAVTGMGNYTYSYATVTYSGSTCGSSTDSVTSVTSSCATSGTGMGMGSTTYTYSSTVYTSSTSYTLSNVSTTDQEATITYYTINLYYVTASTATLTVNKVYTDSSGNALDSSAVSSLEAVFTATPTSGTAKTVTITGASSGTLSLSDGTYTLSETTVPDGYTASDDVTVVVSGNTVTVNGTTTDSVTMTNTAETTVTLYINKVYEASDGSTTTDGISTLTATFTATPTSGTAKTVDITGANIGELNLVEGVTYTLSETAAGGYDAVSNMTVYVDDNGIIYVNGTAITEDNNTITITNSPDDDHPYAGMTYAIVNLKSGSTSGYAMTSNKYNNQSTYLECLSVTATTTNGVTYVESTDGTSEVTEWTFIATSTANVYYITDGNGNYLNISGSSVTVSSTAQEILVSEGSGSFEGMVRLTPATGDDTKYAANLYNGYSYFGAYAGTNDANEYQTLCLVTKADGAYIDDDIVASGNLVATLILNGEEVSANDLKDSTKYTISWAKKTPTIDEDDYSVTYEGDYEDVTTEDALGTNNYTVNVALDEGGLCYYELTIYDIANDKTYTAYYQVPYYNELLNCSFEVPSCTTYSYNIDQSALPFWSTTNTNGYIEIGSYEASNPYGTYHIYAGGSQEAAGDQFAELNADQASSLYQTILTVPEENMYWSFYHRARTTEGNYDATDTMYIVLMSEADAEAVLEYVEYYGYTEQDVLTDIVSYVLANGSAVSGSTNATSSKYGTYTFSGTDITVSLTVWELETETSANGEWTHYYGNYTVPDEQYLTRFFFVAGETEYQRTYNSSDYTVGNLIDYATCSQDITYYIQYWVGDSTNGYTLMKTETGAEYPYTIVSATYLDDYLKTYGLVGSITGTASGGSSPTTFDSTTSGTLKLTGDTMYLSLYLSTTGLTVAKKIDGISDADALAELANLTVTFYVNQANANATSETITVTLGSTGDGSTYTDTLDPATYTIYESGFTDSFSYGGTTYTWSSATVTVNGEVVTADSDGKYTFTLTSGSSTTVIFTNNYTAVTYSGVEMPQTGGRGTKLYTMVGLLLICSGGYLLYRKQRRKCKWRWNI